MKKKKKKIDPRGSSPLKAHRITMPAGDYFVAAANKPQAIGTLMAHLEEDDEYAIGPCAVIVAAEVEVNFENARGGYDKGSLDDIMPTTEVPEVLLDPDYP